MSTAQSVCAASPTAFARPSVPGMMNGTRGMFPKNAASVEIGRKGRSVFARIVACGACAWITAPASGRAA
jgi:hypothetical protein